RQRKALVPSPDSAPAILRLGHGPRALTLHSQLRASGLCSEPSILVFGSSRRRASAGTPIAIKAIASNFVTWSSLPRISFCYLRQTDVPERKLLYIRSSVLRSNDRADGNNQVLGQGVPSGRIHAEDMNGISPARPMLPSH